MSNLPSHPPASSEDAPPSKRVKLSFQRGQVEGLKRFRVSEGSLSQEPFGPRVSSKKSASLSAGRSKSMLASMENADIPINEQARSAVEDIFSSRKPTTPITPRPTASVNGVATPPSSITGNPQDVHNDDAAHSARRHVSGPGENTPRALLKVEADFKNIGCIPAELLDQKGDSISWWIAEAILRVAAYLEDPRGGKPTSLKARPSMQPRDTAGREIQHCCDQGGIEHILPCNLKLVIPAAEAFAFAAQRPKDVFEKHHASKGGINTIAVVGDLVTKYLIGESEIEEEEFKLLVGSESIKIYHGKSFKPYKAAKPSVDPTKQPILFLKSIKKMALQDDLVARLRRQYYWALQNYQDQIGEKPNRFVEPAFAQAAASTPNANLAPAPTSSHQQTGTKRPRTDNESPVPAKRTMTKKTPESSIAPGETSTAPQDGRRPQRPDKPLYNMDDDECAQQMKALRDIRSIMEDLTHPLQARVGSNIAASPVAKGGSVSGQKRYEKHGSRSRKTLLGVGDHGDDVSGDGARVDDQVRLSVPIDATVKIPDGSKFDTDTRKRIEVGIKTRIENYPDATRFSKAAKAVVDDRIEKLTKVIRDGYFRVNTTILVACGQELTDFYALIATPFPSAGAKRNEASSPTDQLT